MAIPRMQQKAFCRSATDRVGLIAPSWDWSFVPWLLELPLYSSPVEAVPPSISNISLTEKEICPYHISGLTMTPVKLSVAGTHWSCTNFYAHCFTGACRGLLYFFFFFQKKFPKVSAVL